MALTIGGGISFGGGISLGPVTGTGGGGGATPNTFTVAEFQYNADTYDGASTISGFTFGTLTSDYIDGIYLYRAGSSNNQDGYTFIRPKDGTYTGFTISGGGLIDGDTASYPRNFIINGTTYRTHCDGYQYFLRTGDPIQLQYTVGETGTITYDPNNQPTTAANTMLVESYTYYSSFYGANADISGPVQGELFSDYFKSIIYSNSTGNTDIKLKDGSYTGFAVSGGSIDGDTGMSTRYFNINGYNVLCTFSAGVYSVSSDAFSLQTASTTVAVSVVYDPAAQGGGGGGTFTDGDAYTSGVDYSYSNAIEITSNGPGAYKLRIVGQNWNVQTGFDAIHALTSGDRIKIYTYLAAGGQGDSIVTLTSGWTNPFGTMYEAEVTLSVAVSTGNVIDTVTLEGVAPAASGTFTVGYNNFDTYGYSDYQYGSLTLDNAMIGMIQFFAPGPDTMIQFINGTYGSVVVSTTGTATIGGETSVTVTIDGVAQTGTLSSGGMGPTLMLSGDPFSLQSKNGNTVNITVVAGAGSGGGSQTTYTSSGNWNYGNWQDAGGWRITLGLSSNPDSAMLTKLNALTSGSSITLSDGMNTQTVTVSSTSGQPWSGTLTVEIYTNTGSTTGSYASIASITL